MKDFTLPALEGRASEHLVRNEIRMEAFQLTATLTQEPKCRSLSKRLERHCSRPTKPYNLAHIAEIRKEAELQVFSIQILTIQLPLDKYSSSKLKAIVRERGREGSRERGATPLC
jgi:hypothetical protein